MLSQISWPAFISGMAILLSLYYAYVAVFFYKKEIIAFLYLLSGRQPVTDPAKTGFVPEPAYTVMGSARAHREAAEEELQFGPSDNPDEDGNDGTFNNGIAEASAEVAALFSGMMSECRTLIRVINESGESKENFEMLFKILVEKYPELGEPPYRQQVTEMLLEESEGQFPFELSADELESYWTNH
ncbi:hypothetical protein SNE26_20495 [Mucilaginibacter sp. cycad4]|uniref:hypothetical protein n=1 Tax=Mucilaginibacter sp. cycad4 TaxID=3342096 RepID=UPI002AAC1D41|nr:hypothetical protein [Mucilaginibacter gossypii]WPU98408.1 hypothetical protein SNE26_20495 [Mucilaginibacter gossypii]